MSHFTDEQLECWLDSWAKWVRGGCSIAALGYQSTSIDQTFIQSNRSPHTAVSDHDLEQNIEKAVSLLAARDRTSADVGRMEYGCHKLSHNPHYDKRNQKKNAEIMGLHPKTYSRKLADFRLAVWQTLALLLADKLAA